MKPSEWDLIKQREVEARMRALRRAKRSSEAAIAEQEHASLVGGGRRWKIVNLAAAVRAMSRW